MKPLDLYLPCAPGLEPLLAAEATALGAAATRLRPGGVAARGHWPFVFRVLTRSALATRVQHDLAFGLLHIIAGRIDWRAVLPEAGVITAPRELRRGILSARPGLTWADAAPADDPAVIRVFTRGGGPDAVVSLDLTGRPLHRRGYRLQGGKAPLREDLARALVVASGWHGDIPLVDPFCGSGTVAIEAALHATTPGRADVRDYALTRYPSFDRALWDRVMSDALSVGGPTPAIYASDRDAGAVKAAKANAARAGVAGMIHWSVAALGNSPWSQGGLASERGGVLVSNPPWGGRVGQSQGLRALYQSLGTQLKAAGPTWSATLMIGDMRLAHDLGVPLVPALQTRAGGQPVTIVTTGVPAK